jgi:hypothetical protein
MEHPLEVRIELVAQLAHSALRLRAVEVMADPEVMAERLKLARPLTTIRLVAVEVVQELLHRLRVHQFVLEVAEVVELLMTPQQAIPGAQSRVVVVAQEREDHYQMARKIMQQPLELVVAVAVQLFGPTPQLETKELQRQPKVGAVDQESSLFDLRYPTHEVQLKV